MNATSKTTPPTIETNPQEISTLGCSVVALVEMRGLSAVAVAVICGAAAAVPDDVTMNVVIHPGHLAIFPARSSGTRSFFPQLVHVTEMGIIKTSQRSVS